MKRLSVPALVWRRLVSDLRKRGHGERESGAFLLGESGSRRASRFICYDDLDEAALVSGIITFHARGFARLWDICQEQNLRVLADVHTHPSKWTGQSESDRTHPMVAQQGHIAIILPNYARGNISSLRGAGIYEYLGDHEWRNWGTESAPVKISLL
jgi:proteasome lid subunit RPN8/RPN11